MTSDFDRFSASLALGFREADWFDTESLGRLVGEERSRAEELLIDLLRAHRDPRTLDALAFLHTPSAHAAIRETLAGSNAELVAHAAAAIAHEDPAAALEGARRALASSDDSAQACAVQVLRRLSGGDEEAELLRALDSPEKNVRILATEGIFDRTGLRRFEVPRRGVSLLWMRLTSEAPTIRHAARAELIRLMEQLKQGRSPEELGLVVPAPEETPALQRYVRSLQTDRDVDDYDLEALDALGPEDRTWAELGLTGLLMLKDRRVPRALIHLRSQLALEPLLVCARELLASAPWPWPVLPSGWPPSPGFGENGLFIVEVARALGLLGRRHEAEETLKLVASCPYADVQARARTALP